MASLFGSDEFVMFAAIFRSPFENTIIDPAVTLSFMSDVHDSLSIYNDLVVYIRILVYIYESCCIYTNLDVYIRTLMYISESCCIYTNLDVYTRILMYISLSRHVNL